MTEKSVHDDKLLEEAIDLLIRWQSEPLNPDAQVSIARWRARSARHQAVWADVVDIHQLSGQAVLARRGEITTSKTACRTAHAGRRLSRRQVIFGGGAVLAAVSVGAIIAPDLLLRTRADYLTATAQTRRIPLSDGSVVSLGPDSALRAHISSDERRVELLAGMAFFEVVNNAVLPFRAVVKGMVVTSVGAAFDLSSDAGLLSMAVGRGQADISPVSDRDAQPRATVSAGEWLTLDPASGRVERGHCDPQQVAAWREGMLVADREILSAVVARIGRWQPGHITIASHHLGAQRISGIYTLSDPMSALRAVVQPYGGKVRQFSPLLTIITAA